MRPQQYRRNGQVYRSIRQALLACADDNISDETLGALGITREDAPEPIAITRRRKILAERERAKKEKK